MAKKTNHTNQDYSALLIVSMLMLYSERMVLLHLKHKILIVVDFYRIIVI